VDGAKNAVTCKGQTIELKPGRFTAVHLLLISAEDTTGEFGLVYKGDQTSSSVRISPWNEAPKYGEHPGFVCLHRHAPDGDQRGQSCYVNHYVLTADPAKELASLVLPDKPGVKVIALTLEKTE
jgi:hypothetical protein